MSRQPDWEYMTFMCQMGVNLRLIESTREERWKNTKIIEGSWRRSCIWVLEETIDLFQDEWAVNGRDWSCLKDPIYAWMKLWSPWCMKWWEMRTDGDRGKCKYQPWPYDTTGTDSWSNKDQQMGWDHLCLEASWLGLTCKLDIWETMLSSQSIIETVKVSPLRLSRESLLDSVDLVRLHTTLEEAIRFSSASLKWLP